MKRYFKNIDEVREHCERERDEANRLAEMYLDPQTQLRLKITKKNGQEQTIRLRAAANAYADVVRAIGEIEPEAFNRLEKCVPAFTPPKGGRWAK
jgi:F0F1-type ATP synthase membrane subunit b/b'